MPETKSKNPYDRILRGSTESAPPPTSEGTTIKLKPRPPAKKGAPKRKPKQAPAPKPAPQYAPKPYTGR